MTNRCTFLVAALAAALMLPGHANAQTSAAALGRLQGGDDSTKASAIAHLIERGQREHFAVCSPDASQQIRSGLIAALEKENTLVHSGASLSETETEFYAAVVGCVAALRDPRAINGLLGAIETGGMAIEGIVALGDDAVPGILGYLRKNEPRGRVAAVMAAGKLASGAKGGAVANEHLTALRATMLTALQDNNRFVRTAAVGSLIAYSDAEVRSAILRVADTDTAVVIVGGNKDYPVRRAAQVWLRQNGARARSP